MEVTRRTAVTPPPIERAMPIVQKRGAGILTGRWVPLMFGISRVGTEFARGKLELVATSSNEVYYQSSLDAIRAASMLSEGSLQGAIVLDHANFIGTELRTVDVDNRFSVNQRPVQYHFEDLAATARGRRELEHALKLELGRVLVDGRYVAVADEDGGVQVMETATYLATHGPAK